MTRFRLDASVRWTGSVVLGGSPLKLFRLTDRGVRVLDRIRAGDDVARSRLTESFLDAGVIHPVPTSPGRFGVHDVTVVVPALGRPGHLPAGAIVVDDGSKPPLVGAAVRIEPTRGPAAARNAGLDLVTTPLVAFVDTDVDVTPGWLEPILPHFDDDRVALVAPRVRSAPGTGRLARWERRHSPLDLGPGPARVRAGSRVSYVPAAAIVCRTDALRSLGGFDPTLRFGEDVDLVWRLDEAGWRCRYEPGSEVVHAPRPTWRAWARQRIAYGSSAAPLAARHPGALAPVRASRWSLAVWALAASGHPLLGGALSAATGAALARRLPDLPAATASSLATSGNLRAGAQLATAIRRAWWPVLVIAAARSRRARGVLVAAALAARHPLAVVDDVAYSLGVWRGVVHGRTLAPLLPDLTSWPGRTTPSPSRAEPLPSTR